MTVLQDFLNSPVRNVVSVGKGFKHGDLFGIEIECEGRNIDNNGEDNNLVRHWVPNRDGSLRDNHGQACEWVFKGPVNYDKSVKRLDILFNYFESRKAKITCSNRTSIHVHFNMGDKNVYQLVNMFILFTIFEDLLDGYCGEGRKGNLFCLSSRHAERQIQMVEDAVFNQYSFRHFGENFRYCSFNLASLNKFCTVEFRGMRGLDNKADVVAWLDILKEFCDYACYTMKNPVELIEAISYKTPLGFLREVFSPVNVARLTEGLSDKDISQSIYDGLRLVQMLCYKIGTEFDAVRITGKDFWASFSDEDEPYPEPDIDPRELVKPRRGEAINALDRYVDRFEALNHRAQVAHFLRPQFQYRPLPPIRDQLEEI